MREQEQALMKRADVVFTGGVSLYEAKRNLHPNVHCQPSAVDVDHFAPSKLDEFSPHAWQALSLQAHLSRPRLGYYGVIDERMNLKLVEALAEAHPLWSIVMVGPVAKIDPATLPRRDNIHWLGSQPYARLPYLVRDWDVCLMPFALNDATQYISPTKTLEYLAAEKPVVSTAVRDVVSLYGEVVHIASNKTDFIELCESVLSEAQRPQSLAKGVASHSVPYLSWHATAEAMLELIHQAMRNKAARGRAKQSHFEEVWSLSELPPGGVAPAVQMLSRGFKLG
jgi:glycosyltransferase involved in cell wall biosynthesis